MCPRTQSPALPPIYCGERRRKVSDPQQPDVWQLIFVQTPPVLRWVLGILTFGLFTVVGMLWRWQVRNVERVETQIHSRMDREMEQLHSRLDETNRLLVEIAQNTRKR